VTLNLTVLPNASTTLDEEICEGESYEFDGQSLTVGGTYTATFDAANGCDSIVTLNLTVLPNASTTLDEEICEGDSYEFDGQSLTVGGTYTATFDAANGCDSIVTLNLTVLPNASTTLDEEICEGDSYELRRPEPDGRRHLYGHLRRGQRLRLDRDFEPDGASCRI
jgi:hypothetical protein